MSFLRRLRPRAPAVRIAAALVALGVALFVQTRRSPAPPPPATAARHHVFAWPAGQRLTYAARWEAVSKRTVVDGAENGDVAGSTLFDGDVSLRSLGRDASGVFTLAFAIEEIRGYSLRVGSEELIGDADRKLAAAALKGQEALVSVNDLGVVQKIAYHHGTPASTRELLSQLVNMMRVTLPAEEKGSTWMAQEPTANGTARVRYDDEGDVLHRTRLSYTGTASLVGDGEADQKMGSKSTIELDPKGFVRLLDDHEELGVRREQTAFVSVWKFRAALGGQGTFDVTAVRKDDLEEGAESEELARERERGRDERLASTWTLGAVEDAILLHGKGKHLEPSFVARAGALVRLHPEACANLVAWFEDPRLNDKARLLVLDVLSSAGSDEAQEAMRQAISTKAVKLAPHVIGMLVQRFVFVMHPNPESARFVADAYDRARAANETRVGYGSAVALGAMIEHLGSSPALASQIDARLRRDLAEKRSGDWSVVLVRALGNARTDEDLPAIAAFADDRHAPVRDEVARALRRFDAPPSIATLLTLTTDPSPQVARSALNGLRELSLTDADWDKLLADVEAGRTPARADSALVDLIERRLDAGTRAARILQVVRARTEDNSGNMDLIARLDALVPAGDHAK